MYYLISLFALTLNPFIWKNYYKVKAFLYFQGLRLIAGIVITFVLTYFGLIDHTWEAFISYGLYIIGIFFILDIPFIKVKYGVLTPLLGIAFIIGGLYFTFIYPITITNDKYEFVKQKVTVAKKDVSAIDEKHIPVVPEKYARYRSEKLIGELKHSSYYDLGESTIQKIDNHLYWVTPIEYTGFFKWFKGDKVPGYIKMSAEDERAEAELVKVDMTYVPSAFFNKDVKRHVRSIHKDMILLDVSFEPDDNDHPYYVIPYGKYEKFRNIIDVKGIYLVDPVTGSTKDYPIDKLPDFIDHAIPTTVAEDWNEWYGKYVHGFWNSLFSQEDVMVPTEWEDIDEVNGVFNEDLQLHWFTDFTRPKSGSGSMVSYSILNARTGKFTFYTEGNGLLNGKSAMNVAEKTFRANKYEAGTPILYTIYGQFTWVVPLMDSNHVFRQMMLINAKDEKVYSTGDTKRSLFDDYKYAIATKLGKDETTPTDKALLKSQKGIVSHVYKAETDRGTAVKFMIKGNDKIFVVQSTDFPYSIFIEKGMSVEFNYIDTEETIASVNGEFKINE
ncbi:DUF1624 domain-containing protein [Heyndrickxia sporothermodurans]|uniref:hypothetical protein n=1 Tax=Heyndrickxia sporothermodurans TaxID=46224 RepID=UPI002DBF3733|nr:hypothetical protein [Heyndrickxia sporothermodurans]MEB6548681.1 DUF1624 domain-containing protein [Heyndrickxia sporothermodurans]